MIKYIPEKKIIVMNLVDLEHCGFDYREFERELSMSGVDDECAKFPIAIMVNVGGGHVLTNETNEDTLKKYHEAKQLFDHYVETIKCEA